MAKNTLGIVIPDINNQELEVDIVGRTSLLVKRFDEKTQNDIEEKQKGTASRTKAPRNPEEEYERARIKNDKGQDCVRSIWFKKGMAAMGGYFGIPRGNVEQGIYVAGDLIPIKYAGKKPIMNTARVRVGQGGMAKTSLAYRPEFPGWSCRLRIGFDAAVLTPHQVVTLLAHAGSKNGVGEWRPQKGGDYGRFDVFPAGASKKLIEEAKRQSAIAAKEAMAAAEAKAKTKAKGKQGRKPKMDIEVDDALDAASEAPVKRKPGRPRKAAADLPVVANKVLKRKPGRPKKVDSDKAAAEAEVARLKKQWGF